jgi:hypothetical protein
MRAARETVNPLSTGRPRTGEQGATRWTEEER